MPRTTMKLLLGALLAAVVLAAAACGSSHPAGTPPPQNGPTVSSSRLILGGTVRCTATLTTPVEVGHELGIVFRFHNVSKRTENVQFGYGGMWVVVRSADGTTYDSRLPMENETRPPTAPTPIAPGATTTRRLGYLRVRWEGPLRITPGCGLSALRPVRVAVTSPGPPADETAAVNDVVAATGHLLDHCRPRASGVSVVGRIDPPSGNAPPLHARCSISLRRERGFYDAQVLVVTPPGLHGVRIVAPYTALVGPDVRKGNTEAIAWEFVVTRRGAASVYSAENDTSLSGGGMAPDWTWTGSEWQGPGGSLCGGSGSGFGGVNGPDVSFVSVCGH